MTDHAPMSIAAIDVKDLAHHYPPPAGRRVRGKAPIEPALSDLSFQVQQGTAFGVLGPNGSGKSTLFHILATLLTPSRGTVEIFGHDIRHQPMEVRHRIGVMFQSPSIDLQLTARENLLQQGRMYGARGRPLRSRIEELLQRFELWQRRDEILLRFSGGMRRRVELAKALVHKPSLLLLDESSTGLDPGARRDMWEALDEQRATDGLTVAMTTHLMEDAARCCRLMILDKGRLVTVDSPRQLTKLIPQRVVRVTPSDDDDLDTLRTAVENRFGPWEAAAAPTVTDGQVRFEHVDGAAVASQMATEFPRRIRAFHVADPTLEDVFLHLTGNRFSDLADAAYHVP